MQRNDLENLLQQHLEVHRKDSNRAAKLTRLQYPFTTLRVDAAELIFFAVGAHANELNEVLMAQSAFLNAVQCLERVNQSKEEFAEVAEVVSTVPGTTMAHYAVKKKDVGKILEIKTTVDALYRAVDEAAPKLEGAIKILRTVGKAHLMERSFLAFETGKPSTPTVSRKAV